MAQSIENNWDFFDSMSEMTSIAWKITKDFKEFLFDEEGLMNAVDTKQLF
jgi:hypothetical protein